MARVALIPAVVIASCHRSGRQGRQVKGLAVWLWLVAFAALVWIALAILLTRLPVAA